ncbi:SUMF1/EgtB/PvdO family nonheme iron enzyme [Vibrio sinaloensis]|uniref:SUMF1/EgtB/PvdO family nonheme iron enzyme n=1 Tax=Photobacterium sp. (strain ATCC 43367) TaxID=379097 RepID=UPI0035E5B13A
MRFGLSTLLLALSPTLMASYAVAQEAPQSLMEIDDQIFTKHSELVTFEQFRDGQQALVNEQQSEITRLRSEAKTLAKGFEDSKAKLKRDYERMINDPNIDIATSQAAYQDAWQAVKNNQEQTLAAEHRLSELQADLDTKRAEIKTIRRLIENLETAKYSARAERLTQELNQSKKISVSFTNRCADSMTLAQCENQTKELALQKAVKEFRLSLIDQLSESNVVKTNLHRASISIHVIDHQTLESGFYDGMRYRSLMDVDLESRPDRTTACRLLNLDKQYCLTRGGRHNGESPALQQEVAWVNVTVGSNLYDDRVLIDGVSYGSTPVEVMLPIGEHTILVEKDGYYPFSKSVVVKSDYSVRAQLKERTNKPRSGDKFADSLSNGSKAPEMITVLKGQYKIGQNASESVNLDHAFGIGATPVTVNQFRTFIEQTKYQTDAELKNTCTALIDGEVTPMSKSSWQKPGFKQYPNSPVVCVSQNDAKAYAKWLSRQTGAKYRLPTAQEWEIAARAGSQNKYWWGNSFKTGKANTGWSGTPWSNVSTAPVSAFAPNKLGMYDAVGNVWQWTNGSSGVAKGGAWNFSPDMAAADQQLILSTFAASNYLGFRVVRELN